MHIAKPVHSTIRLQTLLLFVAIEHGVVTTNQLNQIAAIWIIYIKLILISLLKFVDNGFKWNFLLTNIPLKLEGCIIAGSCVAWLAPVASIRD